MTPRDDDAADAGEEGADAAGDGDALADDAAPATAPALAGAEVWAAAIVATEHAASGTASHRAPLFGRWRAMTGGKTRRAAEPIWRGRKAHGTDL
jgi:hypothetical protein